MDKLKDYLRQHRDELDADMPPVWRDIQPGLPAKKDSGRRIRMITRYAVAACLLSVIALGIVWVITNKQEQPAPNKLVKQSAPVKSETISKAVPTEPQHEIQLAKIDTIGKVKEQPILLAKKKSGPTTPANTELAVNALAKDYTHLISLELQQLRAIPVLAESPGYFESFKKDIRQVDEDEMQVRQDIKQSGLNDDLLEQLINVYQQKLNLLKNLKREVNKMNSRVRPNQSPKDTVNAYFLNI